MLLHALTALAAIAQVLAAVCAYKALKKAETAIDRADKSRRESVAPDWDLIGPDKSNFDQGSHWQQRISLLNTGFGPARDCEAAFESSNGQEIRCLPTCGGVEGGRSILPDTILVVPIQWAKEARPAGVLRVSCTTRYGDRLIVPFELKTNSDGTVDLIPTGKRMWDRSNDR